MLASMSGSRYSRAIRRVASWSVHPSSTSGTNSGQARAVMNTSGLSARIANRKSSTLARTVNGYQTAKIPLENRFDFLTLPTGKKIQVPFEQLIIFSTNLQPTDLADEAFLRRIPYKIEVGDPSREEAGGVAVGSGDGALGPGLARCQPGGGGARIRVWF